MWLTANRNCSPWTTFCNHNLILFPNIRFRICRLKSKILIQRSFYAVFWKCIVLELESFWPICQSEKLDFCSITNWTCWKLPGSQQVQISVETHWTCCTMYRLDRTMQRQALFCLRLYNFVWNREIPGFKSVSDHCILYFSFKLE